MIKTKFHKIVSILSMYNVLWFYSLTNLKKRWSPFLKLIWDSLPTVWKNHLLRLNFLLFQEMPPSVRQPEPGCSSGGQRGMLAALLLMPPSPLFCGRWRSARQCRAGVWHRAAGARGWPARGVHVRMERRGVSQPLWRDRQGWWWRSPPGRGNWPCWIQVGPKELREAPWAGAPILNVNPLRVRIPLLAPVICKLHARVSGACVHTLSPLRRSSQFLF